MAVRVRPIFQKEVDRGERKQAVSEGSPSPDFFVFVVSLHPASSLPILFPELPSSDWTGWLYVIPSFCLSRKLALTFECNLQELLCGFLLIPLPFSYETSIQAELLTWSRSHRIPRFQIAKKY